MLNPAEAVKTILDFVDRGQPEQVHLTDALGRVLAMDVQSPIDIPKRDNSAMDGYAILGADIVGKCPVELRIVEHIPAGSMPAVTLKGGECARIFTGAPIPPGADGVVRQEHTTKLSDTTVRIERDDDAFAHIRQAGEDLKRNSLILERGTQLKPAHLGLLASVAEAEVAVYRSPQVAVMATGDEIADLDDRAAILDGSKIGSSNTYTLLSAVNLAGGVPKSLGIARDDPNDLRARFEAAKQADLLVTSGGVSVGEHDHLKEVFEELGGELKFWRIKMRPGKPVAFGKLDDTLWVGLPGNPVSTMVTFELLVRPAIRKMLGLKNPFRRPFAVRMSEPYAPGTARKDFVRAVVELRNGVFSASTTGAQGSGILSSMAKANALLMIPGDVEEVAAGETVQAILLGTDEHTDQVPY